MKGTVKIFERTCILYAEPSLFTNYEYYLNNALHRIPFEQTFSTFIYVYNHEIYIISYITL